MNDHLAALFNQAIELSEDKRPAFLDRVCAGNQALRRQLEALLISDAEAESKKYMEDPLMKVSDWPDHEGYQEVKGPAKAGAYRIGNRIGQGGMGDVYRGSRDDGAFKQEVAIKVMRYGVRTEEYDKRFRIERQILASLKHPYIAQLIDGGVTEEGRPYFVMEYIEGVPITEYCDANRLTITERLRLIMRVCEAVQAAHQQFVVHRDIKPTNILVTDQGIPKLLDFGIAKALEPERVSATLIETREEATLLTLAYASPEQVKGGAISTATDVYALGILLYELLIGVRPFDFKELSRYEVEHRICNAIPTRPSSILVKMKMAYGRDRTEMTRTISKSRRSQPETLKKRLRGDLDEITLKAIRKEPSKRYTSAVELHNDIERFLTHRPVQACKGSFQYRASKYIRRHRVSLAAALLIVGLITAFTLREVGLRKEAEEAQLIAQEEAETSDAIASFMIDLFDVAQPFSNNAVRTDTMNVRDFLLHQSALVKAMDAGPGVKMRALQMVGRMYYSFGAYDEARELLLESISIADSLQAKEYLFSKAESQESVVRSFHTMGDLEKIRGNYDSSIHFENRALSEYQLMDSPHELLHSSILNGLGDVLRLQGKYQEAESFHRQALRIRQQMDGPQSLSAAHSFNNLGLVLYYQGKHEEAESLYVASIAAYREQLGDTNANVSAALNNLGLVLASSNRLPEAISSFQKSIEIKKSIFGDQHWRVALGMANMASYIGEEGDLERAQSMLEKAYEAMVNALGERHSNTANVLSKWGWALLEAGRLDDAENHLVDALAIQQETLPADHVHISSTLHRLGRVFLQQGKLVEAMQMLEEALEIRVARSTLAHKSSIEILIALDNVARESGKDSSYQARLIELRSALDPEKQANLMDQIDRYLSG